jgi:hypothetical protein
MTGWDVLAIVLFVIIGLPAALLAACAVLMAGTSPSFLILAFVAGAVFFALLWAAFLRKK